MADETESVSVGSDEKIEVAPERAALVKKWIGIVKADKEHWKDEFKQIDDCIQLAWQGADADWVNADNYVVPVTIRHINQAVATLYARNPKAQAKRKQKLMYQIWDGDPQSIQAAMASLVTPQVDPMTGMPAVDPATGAPAVDPQAAALLQEITEVKQHLLMYERLGRTMTLLFDYYLNEQDAGYKEQIKAVVRRSKVAKVGYIKLGFQRQLKRMPEIDAQIADVTSQITRIETLMANAGSERYDDESAEVEELRLLLEDLQSKAEVIVREGPVLSFPGPKEIIPDKNCRHLKTFAGAGHITHEFDMTPDRVFEVYGVDVRKGGFERYNKAGTKTDNDKDCLARVWEIQDKNNQQTLTVCDGYPDFLKQPAEPDVKIERFWTIFPLVFNEAEGKVYPISDVWAMRHPQREYNNARQGLREHRRANRPRYITPAGKLEVKDKEKFASSEPHAIIEINGLTPGEDPDLALKAFKPAPIDPSLYETETTFNDIQRAVGSQEANIGGVSGATATESSIAENSRMSASADNVDDLDTMLSALAHAMGQLMLLELSAETVKEIAGPGAVWPEMPPSREQIAKDLFLAVEAGSSGRPNKAAEMANLERAMPFVLQLPGFNPLPLAKKYAHLLDLDPEDAFVEGLPSITAMNQAMKPTMGAPPAGNDPNQQGSQGADNAERPPGNEPGAQPAFPGPQAGEAPMQMAA